MKEQEDKVKFLFEMIRLNDSYYHGQIPDFEIEHLLKLGVDKDLIDVKLDEYQLTVRSTNL